MRALELRGVSRALRPSGPRAGAGPGGPGLRRNRPGSPLGGRHHLYPDAERMLHAGVVRRLQPAGGGLGDGGARAGHPGRGCAGDGDRSRSRASSRSALRALRPSGPRAGRRPSLLRHPRVRAADRTALPLNAEGGRRGRVRVHRRSAWYNLHRRLLSVSSTRFAALRAACRPDRHSQAGPDTSSRSGARPFGPRAGRRPAFQAVPALLLGQLYALCGPLGRVPAGGRRSKPFPRFFSVGSTRFAALWAACRPEVGVPSRPRASSRSAVRGSLSWRERSEGWRSRAYLVT